MAGHFSAHHRVRHVQQLLAVHYSVSQILLQKCRCSITFGRTCSPGVTLFQVQEGNARPTYKGMTLHLTGEASGKRSRGWIHATAGSRGPRGLRPTAPRWASPLRVSPLLGSLSHSWWSLTIWASLKSYQLQPYCFFFTAT